MSFRSGRKSARADTEARRQREDLTGIEESKYSGNSLRAGVSTWAAVATQSFAAVYNTFVGLTVGFAVDKSGLEIIFKDPWILLMILGSGAVVWLGMFARKCEDFGAKSGRTETLRRQRARNESHRLQVDAAQQIEVLERLQRIESKLDGLQKPRWRRAR